MDTKAFTEIERYQEEKHVLVPVFDGERTKVRLLCLSPGAAVPPHTHEGFEVTLVPLQGKAVVPGEHGNDLVLQPGQAHYAEGTATFGFRNPNPEPFQMLIFLIRK
jgi:quercetin dioxygenase-like cupin family protein